MALDEPGERAATAFLKLHPEVLVWGFCRTGGHSMYVLNEFPLGSRYRVDFVVATSYSGVWEVHMVELENTDDKVMTNAGKPTQRLSGAIAQIRDWKDYVDRNRTSILSELARWCREKDLFGRMERGDEPCNYSGDYLRDPESYVSFEYHVILGRRSKISKETRRRMNQYQIQSDISVGTFDRFLDIAANFDKLEQGAENVRLTDWSD